MATNPIEARRTGAGRSERVNISLTPAHHNTAKEIAAELGISTNAWLGLAIGRAIRQHKMEREILEEVMTKVFGKQMMLELERQAAEEAASDKAS